MKIVMNDIELVRGQAFCERPKDLKIKGTKSLQINTPLRSNVSQVFDRGNLRTELKFEAQRRHDSQEESCAYVMEHAHSLSESRGDLLIVFEDQVDTVFRLKNAVVRHVESFLEGVSSIHRYDIVGESFQPITSNKR